MKRYCTIVVDPPWDIKRLASPGSKGFGTQSEVLRSVKLPYPTMSVAEIGRLPVSAMAEANAHLYLWTVNARIESAYQIVREWEFEPSTLLTWAKTPMGIGPGGTYSQTTEHIVFARRGRLAAFRREDSTWWNWPRGRHSAKPEAFFDMVERVSPGPRLELFARRNRLGWDTWGDECLEHVKLAARE